MTTGNQVDIVVQVVGKGQDVLKNVNAELDKTNKKVKDQLANTDKTDKALTKQNKTLGQQIPILKNLSPLLGQVGLGFLGGSTAIAALGVGIMQASQAFETWFGTVVSSAMASNTLTGSTKTLADSLLNLKSMSEANGISIAQLSKNLPTLEAVTRDSASAMSLLNDAVSISHATGLPLDEVVKNLAGAFDGSLAVFDKTKSRVAPGIDAVKLLEEQMLALANTTGSSMKTVDDEFGKHMESIKVKAGAWANSLKIIFESVINAMMETDAEFNAKQKERDAEYAKQQAAILKASTQNPIPINPAGWNSDNLPGMGAIPGQASGGVTTSAGLSMVGENGPELLSLPEGAEVAPLNGAGGETHIHVHIGNEELDSFVIDSFDKKVRLRGGH